MDKRFLSEDDLKEFASDGNEKIQHDEYKVLAKRVQYNEFKEEVREMKEKAEMEMLYDLSAEIRVKLANKVMTIEEILALDVGSLIELDKMVAEPAEVYAGEVLIAKGETFIIDDKFAVRLTEIAPPKERISAVKHQ